MFVVLVMAIVVVSVVGIVIFAATRNKDSNSKNRLDEFDKINTIEDPLLRQIAINDWLSKHV